MRPVVKVIGPLVSNANVPKFYGVDLIMERLLMTGHCGKVVSPNVFPGHVEGLR